MSIRMLAGGVCLMINMLNRVSNNLCENDVQMRNAMVLRYKCDLSFIPKGFEFAET